MLSDNPTILKKINFSLCKFAGMVIPHRVFHLMHDILIRMCSRFQGQCIINLFGAYHYTRECADCEWFSELTELTFEGESYPVPARYHDYLTHVYGDYMRLPPVGERIQHKIATLDFGKYT